MEAQHKVRVHLKKGLAIVALVVLREENSYGYEPRERLEEFRFEEINPRPSYRTLSQMENEGLCKSEWELPEGGQANPMYSNTEAEEALLDTWIEACERYREVMDSSLSRA